MTVTQLKEWYPKADASYLKRMVDDPGFMVINLKIKELERITGGGLSTPEKMPCKAYNLPASRCLQGGKLQGIAGTTCSGCYAMKNRYSFSNVKTAMENRYQSLHNPAWKHAMKELIRRQEKSGYFRWHDSGDIQTLKHLQDIVWIAEQLPSIQFWLPTREIRLLKEYIDGGGVIPDNLTVRISAFFVDTTIRPLPGTVTSSVVTDAASADCPASRQGNKCLDCRQCWNRSVSNVAYPIH